MGNCLMRIGSVKLAEALSGVFQDVMNHDSEFYHGGRVARCHKSHFWGLI
jgi:hypothetical protein